MTADHQYDVRGLQRRTRMANRTLIQLPRREIPMTNTLTVSDTESLLTGYASIKSAITELQQTLHEHEAEITRRMDADGATELVAGNQTATLKPGKAALDTSSLHGMFELVSEADLIATNAYTPEHEETRTVPAKWSLRNLNKLRRRHRDVRGIIDAATMRGRPTLVVTPNPDKEATE